MATAGLAIALLLAGPLADSLGRKRVMTWTLVATGVIGLLAALASEYGSFLALRTLHGLVMAGLPATAMAYLAEEVHPRYLGTAMGLYIAGNSVGGMSGRIIAGMVGDLWDWRAAVGSIGLLGLLCSLWFSRALPPSRNFLPQPLKPRRLVRSLFQALGDPLLRNLYAIAFLIMGAFVTLYNYISFHLMAAPYRLSSSLVGWIFLLYAFGTLSSAYMGRLADRHGRRPMLALSIAIQITGAVITLAGPLSLKIPGIAIFTTGFFGAHAIASGWVGERAVTNTGAASSLYLFAYYLGSSVTGSVGGLCWMRFGWSGVVAYLTTFLLLALAMVGLAGRSASSRSGGAAAPEQRFRQVGEPAR